MELLENKRQNNQEQRFLRQSGKFEIHVTGIVLRKTKVFITHKIFKKRNETRDQHTQGLIYTNTGVFFKIQNTFQNYHSAVYLKLT